MLENWEMLENWLTMDPMTLDCTRLIFTTTKVDRTTTEVCTMEVGTMMATTVCTTMEVGTLMVRHTTMEVHKTMEVETMMVKHMMTEEHAMFVDQRQRWVVGHWGTKQQ